MTKLATLNTAFRAQKANSLVPGALPDHGQTTTRWAQRLLAQPLAYVFCPSFEDPAREAEILAPMPGAREYEATRWEIKAPRDAPPELAAMYEIPLLSRDQEQHLFRKMNFLKFQAAKLAGELRQEGTDDAEVNPNRERIQILNQFGELLTQANRVKEMLIQANMRLVVNMAKRHTGQHDNFFELLSDGNVSLMRAVEKFDYRLGFKFSTYASRAILLNFSRTIPGELRRRARFVTGHEDFEVVPENRIEEHDIVATQERATHSVNRLLEYLEPREREIIRMRAGLENRPRGMTLAEIGLQFGITKERVRQLNARAMKKLRGLAAEQSLDLL